MRRLLPALILMGCSAPSDIPLRGELLAPTCLVGRCRGAIVADGRLAEEDWAHTPSTGPLLDASTGRTGRPEIRARFLHDETRLYVALEVAGTGQPCVHLVIGPEAKGAPAAVEVTVEGAVLATAQPERTDGSQALLPRLRSAVQSAASGTGWTAELALDWSEAFDSLVDGGDWRATLWSLADGRIQVWGGRESARDVARRPSCQLHLLDEPLP